MRPHLRVSIGTSVAALSLVLLVGAWLAAAEGPPTDQPTPSPAREAPGRWAVVASNDAQASAVGDLVFAELAKANAVELVERQAIRQVLAELKLAHGVATDSAAALKLGELLRADVLVLVERSANENPPSVRVRLVETAVGVRLFDELVATKDVASRAPALVADLHASVEKMDGSADDRHYLSVVGIRSEEPGQGLDSLARSLSTLAEIDLQRMPQVVVLERDQVGRLRSERELTGVALRLRASAVLVEGGVRKRDQGKQLAVSLRLASLHGGKPTDLELVTSSEPVTARRDIADALAKALNARPDPSPADAAAEAAALLARAERASSSREDQARLAEAAFTLVPRDETYRTAIWANFDLTRKQGVSHRRSLEAAIRNAQLLRSYLDLQQSGVAGLRISEHTFDLCAEMPLLDDSESDVLPLYREAREMQDENYRRLFELNRTKPLVQARMIVLRLEREVQEQRTPAAFMDFLRSRVADFDAIAASGELASRAGDNVSSQYYERLSRIMERATMDASEICRLHPDLALAYRTSFGPAAITPLLDELLRHKDPFVRMVACQGKLSLPGDDGLHAAERMLDELFFETTRRPSIGAVAGPGATCAQLLNFQAEKAMGRLRASGRMPGYVERMLRRMEQDGDLAPLIHRKAAVVACVTTFSSVDSAPAIGQRIEKLLRADPEGRYAGDAEAFRLEFQRPLAPPPVATAANPWDAYTITPIEISNRDADYPDLVYVGVDRLADLAREDDPIVLIWRKAGQSRRPGAESWDRWCDYLAARIGPDGGAMREFARFRMKQDYVFTVAFAPGIIFLGTRRNGLTVVRPEQTDHFGEDEGCPTNSIGSLAWLDGRLYLALDGGLASFDPVARTFELLASSRVLRPRHALDGGGGYQVNDLMADGKRNCLWLSINSGGIGASRIGIWKYLPTAGTVERVWNENPGTLRKTDERHLLFLHHAGGPGGWRYDAFDMAEGKIVPLKGYSNAMPGSSHRAPGWLKINDHLILVSSSLLTSDGGSFRPPERTLFDWTVLDHLGTGAVAASERAGKLWHIVPRNPPAADGTKDPTRGE